MAGAVLQTISRDQEERLRLITEHKNLMDWQPGTVEAHREGIAAGRVEGRKEGIAAGRVETAKNLLLDGMEPERVARYTGLSLAAVLELRQDT